MINGIVLTFANWNLAKYDRVHLINVKLNCINWFNLRATHFM